MGRKHGYAYESEILKSIELLRPKAEHPLWYYKNVDTYAYDWVSEYIDGTPKNMNIKQTAQFKYNMVLPKVPGDIQFAYKGRMLFIECKSSKDERWFPIRNIKEHQLEASEELEACGIPYYFFICKRKARQNVTYVVRGNVMRALIKIRTEGKLMLSGIPWEMLEVNCEYELPKLKGCTFDLSFMINDKSILEVNNDIEIYNRIERKEGQESTERPRR